MNPRLAEMLEREHVPYEIVRHAAVYTAQERAAAAHISGRRLAKVVVVRDEEDDWFALAVLPASAWLDILTFREITGRPRLRLAREEEFARLFPDWEVGTVPAFGRMYGGLPVYLDRSLAACEELVVEGGSHHEEVRIPMSAYLRLERPEIVALTMPRAA
jgi:Ala-tRNA(Pro) deacylase